MNKPQLGGIFSIVSGSISALTGLGIVLMTIFMAVVLRSEVGSDTAPFIFMWIIYSAMALFYIALGALAIVGGIFAIRKIRWGWALAGAIAASLGFIYLGIVAVIMVAMSQGEFSKSVSVSHPARI